MLTNSIKENWVQIFAYTVIILGIVVGVVLSCYAGFFHLGAPIDKNMAAQYGGFIGPIVGLFFTLAGIILVFGTLQQQTTIIKAQTKSLDNVKLQEISSLVNEYNNRYKEQIDTLINFELYTIDHLSKNLKTTITPEEQLNIAMNIVIFYTAPYSYHVNDPLRMEHKYTGLFRLIDYIIQTINLESQNEKFYLSSRQLFLSLLSDSEIKMIAYYYYLVHDIVFENKTNVAKSNGFFNLEIAFNDDFRRNLDPTKGHFSRITKEIIRKNLHLLGDIFDDQKSTDHEVIGKYKMINNVKDGNMVFQDPKLNKAYIFNLATLC